MAAMANQQNAIVRERPNGTQDDWREVSLGDLTTIVRGRSYRSAQLQDNDDTALVTLKSFERGGGYRAGGLKPYIGPFNRDQVISPGDMVVARTDITQNGDVVGRPAIVPSSPEYPNLVASLDASIVRVNDTQQLDSRFLYYRLLSWDCAHHVKSWATGTTVLHLSEEAIRSYKFHIPPLPEQRRIAHILGTLDDKIELNRRMNRTLEEIARALFKSWFVDFAPVRAKMDGPWRRGQSLPGLPANLYDLFPDRLTPSELGEIPAGWAVKPLGDELKTLVSGSRPRGGAVDAGIPSIGAENVNGIGRHNYSKEKYIPEAFFDRMKTKGAAVKNGDVLLYKDGARIGRKTYLDCGYPYSDCAVNEHVFILRLKNRDAQKYLFFWLDQNWMTQEIISLNSNSAQPGINQKGVRSLSFMVPSREALTAFDRQTGDFTDRIFANCHESNALAAQRDALLPRLVSSGIEANSFQ